MFCNHVDWIKPHAENAESTEKIHAAASSDIPCFVEKNIKSELS